MSSTSTSTTAVPRPKSLALTILIDWSNQDKADGTTTASVKSAGHPCWLCISFGLPPSGLPQNQAAQNTSGILWQFTMNIYSAERTPTVKKTNEEPIAKERRALLWFNGRPFDKYRYAVVAQHCRFPTPTMPRVVAFHADSSEPDANALTWVRKETTQKQHKEDSYLKVVRGHLYHLHLTFPDGSLVNQLVARGHGFTASLFTYKRKNSHITCQPSRAVTQIRANWLDVVEADPDADELEMARVATLQNEKNDNDIEALTATSVKYDYDYEYDYSNMSNNSSSTDVSSNSSSSNSSSSSSTTTTAPNSSSSTKKPADEWTREDIDALIAPGSTGMEMPNDQELKTYEPHIDLGPEVDSFFDMPIVPSASPAATVAMGQAAGMYSASATPISASDRELLSLFRNLEQRAKSVATDLNSKLRDAALRLTQVLSASGQLGGWHHVERFMLNPDMYSRKARVVEHLSRQAARSIAVTGPLANASTSSSTTANTSGLAAAAAAESMDKDTKQEKQKEAQMDKLEEEGQKVLKNAMTRAKWILAIEKKNVDKQDGKTLDRVLGVLLRDTKWMVDSANFLRHAEQQVSALINRNPGVFAKFRELQSRGVQWPHSPHLRRQIEKAGFAFRPMMIKRDRCVCDPCGVEVSGWRLWHNPWQFHDRSKRHPFALPTEMFANVSTNAGAARAATSTSTSTTTATRAPSTSTATTTTAATTTATANATTSAGATPTRAATSSSSRVTSTSTSSSSSTSTGTSASTNTKTSTRTRAANRARRKAKHKRR